MANICICLAMHFNDHKAETKRSTSSIFLCRSFCSVFEGVSGSKKISQKKEQKKYIGTICCYPEKIPNFLLLIILTEIKLLYLHKFRVELKSCRGYFLSAGRLLAQILTHSLAICHKKRRRKKAESYTD